MYVPPPFLETDPAILFDHIEAYSFGLLVTNRDGEPFATHLPFLAERHSGAHGRLLGHVARDNPQWQGAEGSVALAIFSGPHAYISPTWYAADKAVPTWNYIAVHVYGTLRLIHDVEKNLELARELVDHHEAAFDNPWMLPEGDRFVEQLARGIVGFELEITRLEGKWKLNQNHPADRRKRVADTLAEQSSDDSRKIAELMRRT